MMDFYEMIEVLERHKLLPEEQRQAAVADETSSYWKARRVLERLKAADEEAERERVAAIEARRVRDEARLRLPRELDATVSRLSEIDSGQSLSVRDIEAVRSADALVQQLLTNAGIHACIKPPGYTGAVASWVAGQSSDLAGVRRAECDAIAAEIKATR